MDATINRGRFVIVSVLAIGYLIAECTANGKKCTA